MCHHPQCPNRPFKVASESHQFSNCLLLREEESRPCFPHSRESPIFFSRFQAIHHDLVQLLRIESDLISNHSHCCFLCGEEIDAVGVLALLAPFTSVESMLMILSHAPCQISLRRRHRTPATVCLDQLRERNEPWKGNQTGRRHTNKTETKETTQHTKLRTAVVFGSLECEIFSPTGRGKKIDHCK